MQYAWLVWSLSLIVIWGVVYMLLKSKESKKEMLIVSLWTSLLGLTEPLFVPEYWSPPSLFDLAQRTGFDIESFLFSFGIGGLAFVIYEFIFSVRHKRMPVLERFNPRHRYHFFALISGPIIFSAFLIFSEFNNIHSAIIALALGGIFIILCRPDLKIKMIASALIFLGIYYLYFLTLILLYPGYVESVWNLTAISGILISSIPLEELLFALSFGFFWSGVYEHFTWNKLVKNHYELQL